jgi:hypothetical protein
MLAASIAAIGIASPAAAADVSARMRVDPNVPLGADPIGRLRLYAPDPVDPGSSLSHWDTLASPDLLMEPFISGSAPIGEHDLAVDQLRDIGWSPGTSRVVVHFRDAQGEGFFAPDPLGSQRRAAMQHVAALWSNLLQSSVPINIDVSFDDLDCQGGTGTLAMASPTFIFESFAGADVLSTWYPGALAEALAGANLSLEDDVDPNAGDIKAMFNSRIDQACLGAGATFFYGLSGAVPAGRISFVNTAMHEIAHGLGFVSFVNETTGANPMGIPDIFSYFMRDIDSGLLWHQMNDAQRAASAHNTGRLVWDGPNVNAAGAAFLSSSPLLAVHSPASVAGNYEVAIAEFGPRLTNGGVGGNLVPANDGSGASRDGCQPIQNTSALQGQLALVDRGGCEFAVKARHAQNAGAVGVVVISDQGGPPIAMGGNDPSIDIPAVMIRRDDGARITQAIGAGTTPPPAPPPPPGPGTPKPPLPPGGSNAGSPTIDPAVSHEAPSTCVANGETLCLENGRFRVRARWRQASGNAGSGHAVVLTGDSGYFWFFDPNNVEVTLKVKNACQAPFQHFWFFAAGLTNVEAVIEVVDTRSGRVLTYTNPVGRAFPPVQDTDAFPTCP